MTAPSSSSKGSSAVRLPIGERILRAARNLFLERGYEGASVRVIARRARCSPGMICHLYGSKEQLLAQLVRQTLGKLESRQERIRRLETARAAARSAFDLSLEVYRAGLADYLNALDALVSEARLEQKSGTPLTSRQEAAAIHHGVGSSPNSGRRTRV